MPEGKEETILKSQEPSRIEVLVKEKIKLGKKLGIMGVGAKPVEGYADTDEYKRIEAIDKELWELIK